MWSCPQTKWPSRENTWSVEGKIDTSLSSVPGKQTSLVRRNVKNPFRSVFKGCPMQVYPHTMTASISKSFLFSLFFSYFFFLSFIRKAFPEVRLTCFHASIFIIIISSPSNLMLYPHSNMLDNVIILVTRRVGYWLHSL